MQLTAASKGEGTPGKQKNKSEHRRRLSADLVFWSVKGNRSSFRIKENPTSPNAPEKGGAKEEPEGGPHRDFLRK